jgi:hypothetical protein
VAFYYESNFRPLRISQKRKRCMSQCLIDSFECTSSARSSSSRAIAELESVLGIVRDVN